MPGPEPAADAKMGCVKSADKPGSVEDSHSSGPPVTRRLERPTRGQREQRQCPPIWSCSGWGLPCRSRCRDRGALLPHRFTLACASRPSAVCFLWHFPSPWAMALATACCARPLAGIPLCGARTFLRTADGTATVWLASRTTSVAQCPPAAGCFAAAAAPGPGCNQPACASRHCSGSPARSGTSVSAPYGYSSGASQRSRTSTTLPVLRGSR